MDYRKCKNCYVIKNIEQFSKTQKNYRLTKCKLCVSEYNKIKEKEYIQKREINIRIFESPPNKSCSTCLLNKPIINFGYRLKRDYYIHRSSCKQCELIYSHRYYNERKDDPYFKINNLLRERLSYSLKNYYKSSTLEQYIGCSLQFFHKWIEYQFDQNMNWSNQGNYWHIDHTLPISSFDFTNTNNIYICWNWVNLRPLEAKENLIKHNKIDMVLYNNQLIKADEFET